MGKTVKVKLREEQIWSVTLFVLSLFLLVWTIVTNAIEVGLVMSAILYFPVKVSLTQLNNKLTAVKIK